MAARRSRWGDWSFLRQSRMNQPPPPQTRTMFLVRMVVFAFTFWLALGSIYRSIEIATVRHRVLAAWPEVEGRVVARELRLNNKGSRWYWIALRFRTKEGALVTSRWTEVQVHLPSWSDPNREERPPRYLPGEVTMLRYDPADPARIRVSAEVSSTTSIVFMAGLGMILCASSGYLIWFALRERARAISAPAAS